MILIGQTRLDSGPMIGIHSHRRRIQSELHRPKGFLPLTRVFFLFIQQICLSQDLSGLELIQHFDPRPVRVVNSVPTRETTRRRSTEGRNHFDFLQKNFSAFALISWSDWKEISVQQLGERMCTRLANLLGSGMV